MGMTMKAVSFYELAYVLSKLYRLHLSSAADSPELCIDLCRALCSLLEVILIAMVR